MSSIEPPGGPAAPAGRLAFRPPIVPPDFEAPETPAVNFGDLVRLLGEGIADAQASLDRSSAELVTELATTMVDVVPTVTETIAADGTVSYQQGPTQRVSLLALGVTPTFYQFSQATVEAVMDLKMVEVETSTGDRRLGLFANTGSIRTERKLNRDVRVSSKFTATLVPVPMPVRIEPVRATSTPPPPRSTGPTPDRPTPAGPT